MSSHGEKKNPDKMNIVGVATVGFAGCAFVYLSIIGIEALYLNESSRVDEVAKFGKQEETKRTLKAEQVGKITEPRLGIKAPNGTQLYTVPIDAAKALGMLPKMGPLKGLGDVSEADERRLARTEAIINSMTFDERRTPGLLNASRKKRVARGSGTSVQEINQLIKQYLQMKRMMKGVKSGWMKKAFGAAARGGGPAALGRR